MAENKFLGSIIGLAAGDALGFQTEFLTFDMIFERFGEKGIQEPVGDPALYTDDTQMAIALAEALCQAGRESLDGLMAEVSQEFVQWANSPENNRAPGATCMAGCRQLESGVPWRQSGSVESKGCGANMRVAPVGLFYQSNPQQMSLVARASAIATHAHPTAVVAAEVTAVCVAWALENIPPGEYPERIDSLWRSRAGVWEDELGDTWSRAGSNSPAEFIDGGWAEVTSTVRKIPDALAAEPENPCAILGEGWIAEEALACALFCVMENPRDYVATVRRAANTSGDSDSIACIAGAISGAYLGTEAVPGDWALRLENIDELRRLASALFEVSAGE